MKKTLLTLILICATPMSADNLGEENNKATTSEATKMHNDFMNLKHQEWGWRDQVKTFQGVV
jgi:hypothetical protein